MKLAELGQFLVPVRMTITGKILTCPTGMTHQKLTQLTQLRRSEDEPGIDALSVGGNTNPPRRGETQLEAHTILQFSGLQRIVTLIGTGRPTSKTNHQNRLNHQTGGRSR